MIEGVKVPLNGKEYEVPSLTLKQIRTMQADIVTVGSATPDNLSGELIDTSLKIIHAAMSRNYPDLSLEELGDIIDLRSLPLIMEAVMGVSGLKKVAAG